MNKGGVIAISLAAALLACAGGVITQKYHDENAFRYPWDKNEASTYAEIDWDKVSLDDNYTISGKDETAKTASLVYSPDDDTDYVKVPKTVTDGSVTYSVASVAPNMRAKAIKLPESMTSIPDKMLEGAVSLKGITIPDTVTKIGNEAFGMCSSLLAINIPSSVSVIPEFAFIGCQSLQTIGIAGTLVSIDRGAFAGCASLKSFDIQKTVTSIGDAAFEQCFSISKLEFPSSVNSISNNVASGLAKNATIVINNDEPYVNPKPFGSDSTIYFAAYQSKVHWETLETERTGKDKKVYYKGQWEMKDGKPVLTGKDASVA